MLDIGVPERGIRKVFHIISTVAVDRQRQALRQAMGTLYRTGYRSGFPFSGLRVLRVVLHIIY